MREEDQYHNLCVSKYVSLLITGNDLQRAGDGTSYRSAIIYYAVSYDTLKLQE